MTSNKDQKFVRICDCNTGRFLASISQKQIELIYDTIIKASIESGDWFKDPIKEMTLQMITELKEYVMSNDSDERLPSPI